MAAEGSRRNRPMASVTTPGESRLSASISYILRIGKALLLGLIKTLAQRFEACFPHLASLDQLGGDSLPEEQASGEDDEPDAAQVYSLQEHMLRILQELRSNADITRMAKSISSENPLRSLAEVSEEMFATGVNWGRIVVFFYFTYEVFRESASSLFRDVMDWAMRFLRDRLALWIEQQGGWNGLLNFSPSSQ
ncbi:PREDICTED: apoptosis regulator BAX-like [Thamnophis sirtalis]|uniref:Apoptosis regulator BAX-like n=1 Tax=Thamnophis sirtalis TaxID=35019 RepID=A0A6I9XD29_9SAUR|nr:PREDICTED: apoptosis regulator BAX-like [Thamnophis sirtalis]